MYCKNCGNFVNDSDKFCTKCGVITGDRPAGTQQFGQSGDEPNIGYAILGAVVPLIGLVLYFIWRKEYPLRARSCLRGFFVCIALNIVLICCFFSALSSYINHVNYYINMLHL